MPDPQPPGVRAVFLSYAHEDAGAARRIADALRAAGLEVWFDQNELRGGDAWDQQIRRQIKECALFVPLVSATTNARAEGYFRLEWKLAVDRSHLQAEDHPFLFPIAVGDVSEAGARVPDRFRDVQWTRLRLDETPFEVAMRIERLVTGGDAAARGPAREASAAPVSGKRGKSDDRPAWLKYAWQIVGLAFGVYFLLFNPILRKLGGKPDKPDKPVPGASAPDATASDVVQPKETIAPARLTAAPEAKSAPALPVSNKSVAVLPFANMSEEKDSAFFADGIHEDVLTNLALVRDLRVVSRTSVLQYRDTTKSIRQIAQELGVAYILEGSVRRAGNKVRVTGQLIKAGTDEHVWAKAYNRDLTDLFAIQSELAQEIAGALSAALSPQEKSLLERRPTENLAAYDAYVKARSLANGSQLQTTDHETIAKLLRKAVELDPQFAEAWAELGRAYAYAYFEEVDSSPERLAKARDAIDRAVRLAPDAPDVIEKYGDYFYYAFRDYGRAIEQYQRLAVVRPNDAGVYGAMGLVHRRQGRWLEAAAEFRRALEIDSSNQRSIRALQVVLLFGNRYEEAAVLQRRLVELNPDDLVERWNLALIPFSATGSTGELHALMEEARSGEDPGLFLYLRRSTALQLGEWEQAIRFDREQRYYESPLSPRWAQDVDMAFAFYATGNRDEAMARMKHARPEIEAELAQKPTASLWSSLSKVQAVLGEKEQALRSAQRAMELIPESKDALSGPVLAINYAGIRAWFGDTDFALAELKRLLRTPFGENIFSARHNSNWIKLWDDPRFKALVNDPKNNEPLF